MRKMLKWAALVFVALLVLGYVVKRPPVSPEAVAWVNQNYQTKDFDDWRFGRAVDDNGRLRIEAQMPRRLTGHDELINLLVRALLCPNHNSDFWRLVGDAPVDAAAFTRGKDQVIISECERP